jgi:hypothetical protein
VSAPTSRKARALRIAGIILAAATIVLLSPILVGKMIADARGAR